MTIHAVRQCVCVFNGWVCECDDKSRMPNKFLLILNYCKILIYILSSFLFVLLFFSVPCFGPPFLAVLCFHNCVRCRQILITGPSFFSHRYRNPAFFDWNSRRQCVFNFWVIWWIEFYSLLFLNWAKLIMFLNAIASTYVRTLHESFIATIFWLH